MPREDPLLPFGVLFGDNIFPVSLDGASPPINFKARFFGTEEDTVYVSTTIVDPNPNFKPLIIFFWLCSLSVHETVFGYMNVLDF